MSKGEIIIDVIGLGLTAAVAAASFIEGKLLNDCANKDIEEDNINYTQAAIAGSVSGAFYGLGACASAQFIARLIKLGGKLYH